MKLIRVVSVSEIKTARNGRPYKTVSFQEIPKTVNVGGRNVEVKSNQPVRSRNIWGEGQTEDGIFLKADPLYADIKSGDIVEGSIHTFKTTPYTIGLGESAREVNQYSCVVFSNESPEVYANSQLKANNAKVLVAAEELAPAEHAQPF